MRRAAITLLCTIALLLSGVCLYVQFVGIDYGDKQWEMLASRMWAGGKRIYFDFFPVAPPLIVWIYGVPALLARLPGFPGALPLLLILGLGWVALSVFLSALLISLHPGFASRKMRLEFIALICFVLVFRTTPLYFLDREHLFLVLILPYMMRFMPSLGRTPVPRGLSIAIGIMAGIGFCIKPYCLIVWAGIQLLYALQQKSLRILASIENSIIYATGILYLLLIWLFTPEYFTTVLPMALATYSATRDETPMLTYAGGTLWVLAATFLMFRLRGASPYRRDIFYFAGLMPFFLLYALAGNNWIYTYYPFASMALILTGFMLWEFLYLKKERARQQRPSLRLVLGICLCLAVFADRAGVSVYYFYLVITDTCTHDVKCRGDDRLVAEVQGGAHPLSFGAISIDFSRWTRLSDYSGAPWVTRFPQLWMLPKFLIAGKAFTRQYVWILDYVIAAYVADLNHNRPDVMFVDDTDMFYTAHVPVDLVSLFSVDPDFQAAWKHYRYVHNINLCNVPGMYPHKIKCSYDVYRRVD